MTTSQGTTARLSAMGQSSADEALIIHFGDQGILGALGPRLPSRFPRTPRGERRHRPSFQIPSSHWARPGIDSVTSQGPNPYLPPNPHPGRHSHFLHGARAPGTMPPSPLPFPDPPTKDTLAGARRLLETNRQSIQALNSRIDAAEATLAQIVRESRCAIGDLERERERLKQKELAALAYLSPVRRLPQELVREIFMWCFEDHPCCAWVLAAVCTSWRRLALRVPLLWSKIRLVTTPAASADTIRLWLERSGDVVPLDIEIFLRVGPPKHLENGYPRDRRSSSATPNPSLPPPWTVGVPPSHNGTAPYTVPQPPPPPPHPHPNVPGNVAGPPISMPPSPGAGDPWNVQHSSDRHGSATRSSMHWGHIAFFYLVEQMHRWERFIFRFDRQFASMGALKSINGDAPLLKEFEVSSAEAGFYVEWPWLPNCGDSGGASLPNLRSVTLQHTPFKWSSPMLMNLEHLTLRATPTSHLPLDRIQYILSSSPQLKTLSIHFQGVLPSILSMSPLTLPNLTSFSIGGHYLLTQLVDVLVLPSLTTLALDIESRDPIEDTLSSLLTRSCSPPLSHLSIAYGSDLSGASSANGAAQFYYGPGGIIVSWNVLSELFHLKTLEVGGTPLEALLAALGPPGDDTNNFNTWACPLLERVSLKNCHSHGEGVARLVQLVEARNPAGNAAAATVAGVTPVRMKCLELLECPSLGLDIVRWLKGRVEKVVCTEPLDRSPAAHHPYL
ncbi:hypothetical protein NMY22_g2265 [Coprinellus aureogranulatus]|nr:hypothetical protein NMY22_g2265 [Coprinellus aureogranulatus]